MSPFLRMTVIGGLLLGVAQVASAQVTHPFTFESGTDEGWGGTFGADGDKTNPIVNIGGSNRMQVSNTDSFQETAVASGAGNAFFDAMAAAAANPADYELAYDWYIDTTGANAQFLQLGSYVNTGSGYYAQNFPNTGKEVELDGAQLASGQTFSGTVTVPFTTYGAIPAGETFFRLGVIVNTAAGAAVPGVYYDNISIRQVPEPGSLAFLGLGVAGLALRRRARTA